PGAAWREQHRAGPRRRRADGQGAAARPLRRDSAGRAHAARGQPRRGPRRAQGLPRVLTDSAVSGSLQLQILVRRRIRVAPDQTDTRLLEPWTDAPGERQLVDRDVRHPIVEDLLDLVDQGLALLHVDLARLTLEQILYLGNDARAVDAVLADVRFEPHRRVAACPGDADDHALELLLAPRRGEGGPLHGPDTRLDADGLKVGRERLAHRGVGRPRVEVAGVEAAGIAGFGQELLRPRRIEGRWLEGLRELERARDDAAGRLRKSERLGLVERLPIDGVTGGQPHAPVVPRRLRIPLVGEVEPEDAARLARRRELEPRRSLNVFGNGTGQQIRDVHLTLLEGGSARGLLGQAAEHEPFDAGRLAPVALVGLQHQFDARVEAHEA